MYTDITGILLIPGDHGRQCPGNGMALDRHGNLIECCCDECDYMLKCFPEYDTASKNENRHCFLPETEKNTCKFP